MKKTKKLNQVYFISMNIVDWIDLFTKESYCEIVLDSLRFCQKEKGLEIYAWSILPGSINLIAGTRNNNLTSVIRDFKTHTNRRITNELKEGNDHRKNWILNIFEENAIINSRARYYKVWKDGSNILELLDEQMIKTYIKNIHENPIKKVFVNDSTHYKYSSAIDYRKGKGLINIVQIS